MNPNELNYYTVQNIVGPDTGLHPINEKNLTRLQLPPASTETALPFEFKFEGNTVQPRIYYNNGVDTYLKLYAGASNVGLVLPWYIQNTTNSFKTDSEIETLIKSSNFRVKPCGIWYGVLNEGLIVRWRHFLNAYTSVQNSVQIEFDCFIYNNGTIEFRYSPKNSIYTSTQQIQFSSTPVFRSYLRSTNYYIHTLPLLTNQDEKYGGFRSASNTSSSDLNNWPGRGDLGAITRLVPPPQAIKKILPRLELKKRDQEEQVLFDPSMFDDSRTIVGVDSVINMPTQLPRLFSRGSTLGNPDPNVYSDFDITGSIKYSSIDPWLPKSNAKQIFSPYSETQQPEQNLKDTEFYLTGTAVSDVGVGFEGNLGQKTKITYELPILASTALDPLSASLYYYDTRTKSIKQVGDKQNPRTKFALFGDARLFTALGTPVNSVLTGNLIEATDRLIPFKEKPNSGLGYTKARIDECFQTNFINSDLLFLSYSFGYNNVEPITFSNQLEQPFLLEKVIFELPLEAGSSWLNDYTQLSLMSDFSPDIGGPCVTVGLIRETPQGSTAKNYDFNKPKVGGGDIVFEKLPYDTTRREIICSGTIIPYRDSIESLIPDNPLLFRGIVETNKKVYQLKKGGYLNFGAQPSAIIGNQSTNQFTGSVTVNSIPQVVNCFYYSKHGFSNTKVAGHSGENPSDFLAVDDFDLTQSTLIQNYKSLGITGNPSVNDYRNIFGRDKRFFQLKINNPWKSSATQISSSFDSQLSVSPTAYCAAIDTGVTTNNLNSPYLLFPNDKLSFFVSKYRSVNTGSFVLSGSGYLDTLYNKVAELSASHDIKIPSGTLKISLYGSYVRNKKEYSFNESPFSTQVAGVIGDEPILDQFELYNDRDLIGTTFDRVVKNISGSIMSSNNFGDGYRSNYRKYVASLSYGVNPINNEDVVPLYRTDKPDPDVTYGDMIVPRRSALPTYKSPWTPYASEFSKMSYEIMGMSRINRYESQEVIYDSLVPRIDDILKVEGVTPVYISANDYSKSLNAGFVALGKNNVNNSNQPYDFSDLGNIKIKAKYSDWVNSFPFESKYNSVNRQKDVKAKYIASGSGGQYEVENLIIEIGESRYTVYPGEGSYTQEKRKVILDIKFDPETEQGSAYPNQLETNKFFYGFGNGKLEFNSGSIGLVNSVRSEIISQQFPTFTYKYDLAILSAPTSGPSSQYILTGTTGVSIKGWKYGLYNGFPTTTSCIFRRNKFGQFRDMLEQRPFTVFLTDKGLKTQGPVRARFVQQVLSGTTTLQEGSYVEVDDPYTTSLQNLSTYVTSSLPFFDGLSRDR